MINVAYNKKFIKDLKELKSTPLYNEIVTLCYETIPNCETIETVLAMSNIKKMTGWTTYYRFRVGDYRIGVDIEVDESSVTFVRVMNRKSIYDYFPIF
jgi:mRNA-degrading endonuclease RelE of RelBE toxin-antitoxin system